MRQTDGQNEWKKQCTKYRSRIVDPNISEFPFKGRVRQHFIFGVPQTFILRILSVLFVRSPTKKGFFLDLWAYTCICILFVLLAYTCVCKEALSSGNNFSLGAPNKNHSRSSIWAFRETTYKNINIWWTLSLSKSEENWPTLWM